MAPDVDVTRSAPTDRYIDVGDVRTRYWAEGKGKPLLLVHGFADSVETWSHVFAYLAERYRVFALDVVGAGLTGKPGGPMPFSRLAQFVRDFMDAHSIERASIIGQSMGGGTALNLAIRWPEKVDKLILVDAAGLGKQMPLALRVCTLPVLGWLMTLGTPKQTRSFLRKCVYDSDVISDSMVNTICEHAKVPKAHAAMRSWLQSNADFGGWRKDAVQPILGSLGSITAPTLVVWGRQDWVIPVAHGSAAVQGIPGAKLHVFDPCGHVPQLERPGEFASLVTEFLG
ncbi:MAG: alpha/beta fold hydrolase [Actinobacteria bacterium]|nr:alpha/beta fold hydrolase [Actinomycetota bacterium]